MMSTYMNRANKYIRQAIYHEPWLVTTAIFTFTGLGIAIYGDIKRATWGEDRSKRMIDIGAGYRSYMKRHQYESLDDYWPDRFGYDGKHKYYNDEGEPIDVYDNEEQKMLFEKYVKTNKDNDKDNDDK